VYIINYGLYTDLGYSFSYLFEIYSGFFYVDIFLGFGGVLEGV
jgi:hypothetical protein